MTMFKVKKVYVGAVFNTGKGEWIPKFVFEDKQVADNWRDKDISYRRIRSIGLVTGEEV